MEWDTACRAKDDSFLSFVITWYAGATSSLWPPPPPPPPNNSIHPKKIIIPVSIHSNAFVPLFKFETSWSLFCRLSRGFVAISGASNLRFSWNCSRHGLPTVYSYLVVLIFFVSNLVQNYFSSLFRTVIFSFFLCLQNHWPFHHRKFGFFHFLSVISTDKPVNRSKHAYALTQLKVFAFRGFFLSCYSQKNKEGVWANRATKYKKYVAGKCTRTRALLARKCRNRILESQDGTTSIKY